MKLTRTLIADLLFLSLIFLLVLVSLLSYQRIIKANTANEWVNHTDRVKLKLQQILSAVLDAETSQRGFLLSKDSSLLGPYYVSQQQTSTLIEGLDSLTLDNPKQQVNLAALQRMIALRYGQLGYTLSQKDRPEAEMLASIEDGNRYMKQFRSKIGEMNLNEQELLNRRVAERNRYAALTPLYTLLLSFFAILIVTLVYFRLRKETKLRYRAQYSEATIHNFFMEIPAMVAILKGPEHRFEFANPLYLELVGRDDIVGKTTREIFEVQGRQESLNQLDNVFNTGITYRGEEVSLPLRGRDSGQPAIGNIVFQPIRDRKGTVEGVLIFCYDVSEMVANRNKIEETEQRLRLAIEAASIGTFDWDFENNRFLSSPRLTEIFGFPVDEGVTHVDLLSTFHPEDKVKRDRAVEASYEKGSLAYEARIFWPDHSIRWINVFGKVAYDQSHHPLRMYGTVIDITPQRKILEEIQESESRFRLLANSLPQLIWTGDEKGQLDYFNDSVFRYTGLDKASMAKEGWLNVVHPDDRELNRKKWAHSVESGEEFALEHRVRNHLGEYRWQLSRALPQKDVKGRIQRWVGTSTDIQEQRNFVEELEREVNERTRSLSEANERLENSIKELERINAELESFNYIASHDLQEPLRKIIAFSQRIRDRENDKMSEFSKDYFSRIMAASSRMQHLIDAFLSYSYNTDSTSNMEETNLIELLDEVRTDLSNVIEEKNASVIAGHLPVLKIVRIQFYQVFSNLISNSLKYSRPGIRPLIRITASTINGADTNLQEALPEKTYWQICFEDNGIGFEQQYVNKIFQLFQRLHAKSEYAGTGIGLAMCKKIIANHKGFISAEGRPGEGSVFRVFIPVEN